MPTQINTPAIYLVEPKESLNIGAVARAMSNLGLTELHLVAPQSFDLERAKRTACWGGEILDQAKVHTELQSSLSEMEEVVGFSARSGCYRPAHINLDEWIRKLQEKPTLKRALLFGPEDTGLTSDHVAVCRWLVRIPSKSENPSFNIAQAVLIVLWEIAKLKGGLETIAIDKDEEPASWEDFSHLENLITEVASKSGFYKIGTPGPVPGLVNNMLKRIYPNKRELAILLGLFSRIQKSL